MSRRGHRVLDNKRGMLGLCYVLDSHLQWPRTDQVGFKNVVVIREAMGGKYHRTLPGFDDHAAWGGCQVRLYFYATFAWFFRPVLAFGSLLLLHALTNATDNHKYSPFPWQILLFLEFWYYLSHSFYLEEKCPF